MCVCVWMGGGEGAVCVSAVGLSLFPAGVYIWCKSLEPWDEIRVSVVLGVGHVTAVPCRAEYRIIISNKTR